MHISTRALSLLAGVLAVTTPAAAQFVTVPVAVQAPASSDARSSADTLTLDRALRIALERNRDVRIARLALEEASRQAGEAWSSMFPQVELNASYTRNVTPQVSFLPAQIFNPDAAPGELIRVQFGADNVWNNTISLEQPIFQARSFIGVGAAGRYESLQQEILRGATQSVATRVRVAYYDVLLSQERHRLLDASVQRVRASLDETTAMHRAGFATEYDVLRLEVELANLESNLRRARDAVIQARRNIAVELALPDLEGWNVAGSLADLDLASPEANTAANRSVLEIGSLPTGRALPAADAFIAAAQEDRSEIRQLELTRSLRRAELRAEQLEYAPKVSLFANYTINAQESGTPNFFGASSLERSYGRVAGITVSMPLFTGFRERARVGQKRAVVRSVETQLDLTRDRVAAQVRSLVERVDEAAARADAQRLAVRQARRGFDIASAQHREGISSQLERTDAEVALRQSEFNYAEAVYDYLVARAQLDEATGRAPATR